MNYQYYNLPQSYSQTPVSNSFDQRRSSSSASQPHAQSFHAHNFQPRLQDFPPPNQYGFDQSNGWTEASDELVDLSMINASNFNPTDIHEYTSSAREPPWDPTRGSKGREIDNSVPFTPPAASHIPKANTVAGPLRSPDVFKRPSLGPRQSFASIPDSGYGSQPALVDGIPSFTQAKLKENDCTAAGTHLPIVTPPLPPSSVKTDPSPSVKRRRSKSFAELTCHCGKELKNRSDAVKHKLQHEKPFRCDLCSRNEGFATKNDLERHRKSKHEVDPRVGKATKYVCHACRPSPGSKEKLWPRLDNFKAHVKRKHAPPDLDHFIKSSEIEPSAYRDSHYACSQASVSNPPDEMTYQQDLSSPSGHPMSRHTSRQQPHADFHTLFGQNSAQQIAHVGGAGGFPGNDMPPVQFRQPNFSNNNPIAMLHDAAYQEFASPAESMNISPTNMGLSIPSISLNDQVYDHTDEMERCGPLAKRARVQSPVSPTHTQTTTISANGSFSGFAISSNHPEGQYPCSRCEKVKRRECDLRKHMKRHTRPYGCTFAKCNKRFGSRNDWKRHENSQHFLSEMWRCSLERPNGSKCGHLSHDQQQFARHLELQHDIKDKSEESKTQCRNMHLGREGHHHFWCGFCDQLIAQAGPGAWDVRFKHIGDHFDKENRSIDDWVDIETNKKKKLIETEEEGRNADLKSRIDDDSDLGEDGIPFVPNPYRGQIGRFRRIANEDVDADGVSDDETYMG